MESESTTSSVAVVGATGVGLVYVVSRQPENGETLVAESMRVMPGGKASNQAIGVARLGGKAALFSALGGDVFAGYVREVWRREHVADTGVIELSDQSSLVGSVLVDPTGDNRIVLALGAMAAYDPMHVDAFEADIAMSDACLVSLEMPSEPAERALQIARKHGVTTILNPAPAPDEASARRLLPLCDWVTPNEVEAAAMTGDDDSWTAASSLRDLGARGVVVTLGAKGALLHTGETTELVPAPDVTCLDTSGAGDAFNAAFAVTLARGDTPGEAVRLGCLAGSLIVQGPGFVDALHLLDQFGTLARH